MYTIDVVEARRLPKRYRWTVRLSTQSGAFYELSCSCLTSTQSPTWKDTTKQFSCAAESITLQLLHQGHPLLVSKKQKLYCEEKVPLREGRTWVPCGDQGEMLLVVNLVPGARIIPVADDLQESASDFESKYAWGQQIEGYPSAHLLKYATDRSNGKRRVVKIVESVWINENYAERVPRVLALQHPNIVCLLEVLREGSHTLLVCEDGGVPIFDHILALDQYNERECANLARGLLEGVAELHEAGIVHGDLKPALVLCSDSAFLRDPWPFYTFLLSVKTLGIRLPRGLRQMIYLMWLPTGVKLADAGFKGMIKDKLYMQCAVGVPTYVAPEILTAEGYDCSVDMWSFGVLLYQMLCGFSPFYGDTIPELFEQILCGDFDFPEDYWDSISQESRRFIERLLVVKPNDRLSARDALKDPWFAVAASFISPLDREKLKRTVKALKHGLVY